MTLVAFALHVQPRVVIIMSCHHEDLHDHTWKWVDAEGGVRARVPEDLQENDPICMMYSHAMWSYECDVCGGVEVKF